MICDTKKCDAKICPRTRQTGGRAVTRVAPTTADLPSCLRAAPCVVHERRTRNVSSCSSAMLLLCYSEMVVYSLIFRTDNHCVVFSANQFTCIHIQTCLLTCVLTDSRLIDSWHMNHSHMAWIMHELINLMRKADMIHELNYSLLRNQVDCLIHNLSNIYFSCK